MWSSLQWCCSLWSQQEVTVRKIRCDTKCWFLIVPEWYTTVTVICFLFFKRLDAVKSVGITLYLPLFIVLDQNNDRKLSCIETSLIIAHDSMEIIMLLRYSVFKICLRYSMFQYRTWSGNICSHNDWGPRSSPRCWYCFWKQESSLSGCCPSSLFVTSLIYYSWHILTPHLRRPNSAFTCEHHRYIDLSSVCCFMCWSGDHLPSVVLLNFFANCFNGHTNFNI